jgi:DNA repair protein RadC
MICYLRKAVTPASGVEERFHAVFLDRRNTYLADYALGRGGVQSLTVRMREVFAPALRIGASGLILAHNHPSGKCSPSASDIAATRRIMIVAEALEIEVVDHLIITHESVFSMRAAGLI